MESRSIECVPHKSISNLVGLFWFSKASPEKIYEILPDGCIDVVFELLAAHTHCLVFGTTTQKQEFAVKPEADYFGIRFQPGMARHFLTFSANELTNNYLPLESFLGVVRDQLFEAGSFKNRLALIENSILNKIRTQNIKTAPVDYAVQLIQNSKGNVGLEYLSSQCNLSIRQLQRVFIEDVGVTPKTLCRIMRIRAAIDELRFAREIREINLAELAIDLHYSDQAHMCRDFRLLAGCTPTSLLLS